MKWPQGASGVVFAKRHFIIPKAANLEDISDAVAAEMFGSMELPGMSLGDIEGGLVGYDELVASGGTNVFGDPIDGSAYGALDDVDDDDDEDELFEGFFKAVAQGVGKGLKAVGKGTLAVGKGIGKGAKFVATGKEWGDGKGGVGGAVNAVGKGAKFVATGREWGDKKGGVLGVAKTVATGREWGDKKGGIGGAVRATGRGVKKVASGSSERRAKRQDRREGRRERREGRTSDMPMVASYQDDRRSGREEKRNKRQERRDRRRDLRQTDEGLASRAQALRQYRQAERMDSDPESLTLLSSRDVLVDQVDRINALRVTHSETPPNVREWLKEIDHKIATGRLPAASQMAEDLMHAINVHGKNETAWGQDVFAKLWPLISA